MAKRPVSRQGLWGLALVLAVLAAPPQAGESRGEEWGHPGSYSRALLEADRADQPAPLAPAAKRFLSPAVPEPSVRGVLGLFLPFLPGPTEAGAPQDWEVQEFTGIARFQVAQVGRIGVIRLESEETSFALHRDVEVELEAFPYLTWAWRVDALPHGGDVRRPETDDQAAQLYVVFPRFPAMVRSRIVGYVWDSSAPAGSTLVSPATPLARIVVLQSGSVRTGHWVQETRNLLEDYRRLFQEDPPPVGRISLLINSQHTRSRAVAWFGPIRFAPQLPRRGVVPVQASLLP